MRYVVPLSEIEEVIAYDVEQRMDYFLARCIEGEEIWGLSSPDGWAINERDNQYMLPIWPYEQLATSCAGSEWKDYAADAISLDHFINNTLLLMQEQNIMAELMPVNEKAGKIISAKQLAAILGSMVESGEYYMEG